jgi:hypothetical protein
MSELASEVEMDLEREDRARSNRYVLETFQTKPEGVHAEHRYDGGPYDSSRIRLKPNGWDHEHCFLSVVRIEDGDSWWSAWSPHTGRAL